MEIDEQPELDLSAQPAPTERQPLLALAEGLEWDTALIWTDDREDYGEDRQCALVLNGVRLYFVAFVDRDDVRRIISLRKSTNQEQIRYVRDVFNHP